MKQIISILALLISCTVIGQTFHKVGQDVLLDESTVSQSKLSSYIYLKNESNYNTVKNDIYRFFDSQISLKKEDYNPSLDPTTSFVFYIYKTTNILNNNFVFDEDADPNNNPMIYNRSSDIIAIVSYDRIGKSRSIDFYSNKKLEKLYVENVEKQITNSYRDLVGDID